MYLNKVSIIGFVGQESELRVATNGTAFTTLSVAVKESWKVNDEWKERTEWFNVSVWGKRAQYVAEKFKKGSHVLVEGPLQSREYDKEGQKHKAFEIRAKLISSLDRPANGHQQVPDQFEATEETEEVVPF